MQDSAASTYGALYQRNTLPLRVNTVLQRKVGFFHAMPSHRCANTTTFACQLAAMPNGSTKRLVARCSGCCRAPPGRTCGPHPIGQSTKWPGLWPATPCPAAALAAERVHSGQLTSFTDGGGAASIACWAAAPGDGVGHSRPHQGADRACGTSSCHYSVHCKMIQYITYIH